MQRTDRPVIDSSNYESQSIFRGAVVACPAIVCFIYYGVQKSPVVYVQLSSEG